MKLPHAKVHMEAAHIYAKLSHATRLKVGCLVVKDDRIISIGVNGMPPGWSNECEENGKTKPDVLHAEENAIGKLAASTESGEGATVFVTAAPCRRCARLLARVQIKKVYYDEIYSSSSSCGNEGLEHLKKHNIEVEQLKP